MLWKGAADDIAPAKASTIVAKETPGTLAAGISETQFAPLDDIAIALVVQVVIAVKMSV